MKQLVYNGLSLEYDVIGTGDPFVFLHGMGGSVSQIYKIFDRPPGIQLITMNQQGHGNSDADWSNYNFNSLGNDVIALLDKLGLEHVVIGGISMGAAVGLNIATRFPKRVEKLFLIRNAWTDRSMSVDLQKAYEDLGHSLEKRSIKEFYQTEGWKIVKKASSYTQDAFTGCFEDPSCLKNWQKYLVLPNKVPVSSVKEIQSIKMPVYIVANKNDLCHPFEYGLYLRDQIKNASFYEIPDKSENAAGHRRAINEIISKMIKQ